MKGLCICALALITAPGFAPGSSAAAGSDGSWEKVLSDAAASFGGSWQDVNQIDLECSSVTSAGDLASRLREINENAEYAVQKSGATLSQQEICNAIKTAAAQAKNAGIIDDAREQQIINQTTPLVALNHSVELLECLTAAAQAQIAGVDEDEIKDVLQHWVVDDAERGKIIALTPIVVAAQMPDVGQRGTITATIHAWNAGTVTDDEIKVVLEKSLGYDDLVDIVTAHISLYKTLQGGLTSAVEIACNAVKMAQAANMNEEQAKAMVQLCVMHL